MDTTLTKPVRTGLEIGQIADLRDVLLEEKQRLERLLARIERVLQSAAGAESSPVVSKLSAKNASAHPSPLDQITGVLAATADLRVANGNLSADRVAKLFGVSLSQLAGWLGRTKQAVAKTPDAESLQNALECFERVARLRLVTENDDEFRKWLRMRNETLRNRTPLELLTDGQFQTVADKVEDMLTGMPT